MYVHICTYVCSLVQYKMSKCEGRIQLLSLTLTRSYSARTYVYIGSQEKKTWLAICQLSDVCKSVRIFECISVRTYNTTIIYLILRTVQYSRLRYGTNDDDHHSLPTN